MLKTAKKHFDQDIVRAESLAHLKVKKSTQKTHEDVLRAAVMMAVGAADAYFCDAYSDLVSRTIRAKEKQPDGKLENRIGSLKLDVNTLLESDRGGWRWRNSSRKLMEKESALSTDAIRSLFNQFFPNERKILTTSTIAKWLLCPGAKVRMFGISQSQYQGLKQNKLGQAKKDALKQFNDRLQIHFQRRHDCIHNCDRPKTALQSISESTAVKTIEDMQFLVDRCHDALLDEYPRYLKRCSFSAVTRNAVGAPPISDAIG